jgi:dsRNA-specific ribonuclease
MVTNAVNARLAWSYGLDSELKATENIEALKRNLKIMETMYEAYIGAMVIAAEKSSCYQLLLSDYMARLFTEKVFPDLHALKSVPAPCT